MNVTLIIPDYYGVATMAFPVDIEAWRRLLGGQLDLVDCRDTMCPCAIVMRFQNGRVLSEGRPNDMAAALLDEPVFGPAVLVAGASAVDLLDQQFRDWEGDDDEPQEAGMR